MLAIQLFESRFDRAHFRALHWIMGTNPRCDFGRNAVFAERKASLLIRSAAHRERACVDHPVEWPVGASLDRPGSSILQCRIPIFVGERHFGFRYMPVSIPRFNHTHLVLKLVAIFRVSSERDSADDRVIRINPACLFSTSSSQHFLKDRALPQPCGAAISEATAIASLQVLFVSRGF